MLNINAPLLSCFAGDPPTPNQPRSILSAALPLARPAETNQRVTQNIFMCGFYFLSRLLVIAFGERRTMNDERRATERGARGPGPRAKHFSEKMFSVFMSGKCVPRRSASCSRSCKILGCLGPCLPPARHALPCLALPCLASSSFSSYKICFSN